MMTMELEKGLKGEATLVVSSKDTALSMGSGDMPVLATPAMLALMEHAAMTAVAGALPEGSTTVGGYIESSHLRPSKIRSTVVAKAVLTETDGRKLTFTIEAYDGETLIGSGKHLRFVVDRKRFLEKL